jgi:3-oxoacyl-[acyl-carrier protein] reductase
MPLTGKTALLTGAGRGIGREAALKFARAGANLVINDLDHEPLEQVAAEARALGVSVATFAADATAPDFGDRFVDLAVNVFGVPDIIVNNAGYPWDAVIQKTTDEQFDAMVDLHLKAPFRVLRAAAPHIRDAARAEAAEGREVFRKVVNISSLSGVCGNAGQSGYAVGKAGIVGLTKTLAKEWGRYKVNVNAVAFGLIGTRLVQALGPEATIKVEDREIPVGLSEQLLEQLSAMIPLGRPGKPEEAAGAIYLLCLPESDYISGQVVICSGGLTI